METPFGNGIALLESSANSELSNGGSGIRIGCIHRRSFCTALSEVARRTYLHYGSGREAEGAVGRIQPPSVKESDCDVGTALYAPTEAVFTFRFVFALILLYYGTTNDFHGPYHWLSYVNITASVAFLLLAICSLCVVYECAPPPILGYFVEAFYFVAASLTVASLFNVAALSCIVAHFTMAPMVRVRPVYIILPLLCHVPNLVEQYSRTGSVGYYGDVIGEFIGILAASLFVLTLTKMKNFKEVRFDSTDAGPAYVAIR